ncbi:hypothetical protein R1sor_009785 [Riccia sorocarpa]|uniref:Pre-mRNA-splicing factor Syf1-like N-terminal HAT-repeats domain-containing protein n=1 Tax=Riccia sorocarpa TaxID=122646 RepID=A0ABD3HY38_9MARC
MNLMDDPAALLRLLMDQKDLTRILETFDRALHSVPVIHHDCIRELYLQFVRHPKVPIWIVLGVYELYLKFDPTRIEEFIDFLLEAQEAGLRLKNSESLQDDRLLASDNDTSATSKLDSSSDEDQTTATLERLENQTRPHGNLQDATRDLARLG